ncbi:MAG: magnesium transporter [Paracoccaceae bacterium]
MSQETPDPDNGRADADERFDIDPEIVAAVYAAIDAGDRAGAAAALSELHAADIADLVEQMDASRRRAFLPTVWPEIGADFLVELEENIRDEVLSDIDPALLSEAARDLDSDDLVYLLEGLDDESRDRVVSALDPGDRLVVAKSLEYPDYSAGRLMNTSFVKAPPFWTVGQMIDEMRASDDLPEQFYDVIVVDPAMRPLGKIPLAQILRSPRPVTLEALMQGDLHKIHVEDAQEDVAYTFNQYHLVSAPVVDDDGRLVGTITIDDAMEVLEDEAEEDIKRLAGVGDEEISDTVWAITRRRFPWLAVNLATAILASMVIAIFDDVIQQVVALAILMPIVASMGGNAGTQTLTVAVRALATRDLTPTNALRIVQREVLVGLLNGLAFAVVMAGIAWVWFADPTITWVIGVAMVVNLLMAGLSGILVPLALERLGADPALASGTFVTTVTDVVGFFAFLGLAALVLL